MKKGLLLVAILVAAAIFAGCSANSPATTTGSPEVKKEAAQGAAPQANSEVKEIVITAKNMGFEPKVVTVDKGTEVKLIFRNEEDNVNNLVIEGTSIKTENVAPKQEQTIKFVADRPGEFNIINTVSGMNGMAGKFIVK